MSTISRLWADREVPAREGLYLADGRAWSVVLDASALGSLTIAEPFDVDALLEEDPEFTTSTDTTYMTVEISPTEGYLCCGEGSHGSEGYLAKLDPAKRLVWVVYLAASNPFMEIEVRENVARFLSSSGVTICVDVRGICLVPATWPEM